MDIIFETNSSFHVKQLTAWKVQFLLFRSFLLVLTKFSFREEYQALSCNSMKRWDFPGILKFPKIISLKSFNNSFGHFRIPRLLQIITLCYNSAQTPKGLKFLWPWLHTFVYTYKYINTYMYMFICILIYYVCLDVNIYIYIYIYIYILYIYVYTNIFVYI